MEKQVVRVEVFELDEPVDVYDIQVETDESFIVSDVVLHNSEICKSRDGMIIERTDAAGLAGNTPALHYKCRSTLSPILTRVNRAHRAMFNDPSRRRQNRELAALLPGWN